MAGKDPANWTMDTESYIAGVIFWPIVLVISIFVILGNSIYQKGARDGALAKEKESALRKRLAQAEKDKKRAEELQKEAEDELEKLMNS